MNRLLGLMLIFLLTGCSTIRMGQQAKWSEHDPNSKPLYVVSHGWHTGLVLRGQDIDDDVWPDADEFKRYDFVEIGWGDAGFYQAKQISIPLLLDAFFVPSGSVMHVACFDGKLTKFFPVSDVIEIPLGETKFKNLCKSISGSFKRDSNQSVIGLGQGLYGDSQFFEAEGLYFFPKTCNVWTANQLHAAGCPIWFPSLSSTADGVLWRARQVGRTIQESPRGLKFAALFGGE